MSTITTLRTTGIALIAATLLIPTNGSAQVAINETGAAPDASAILDVSHVTGQRKGFLAPRMSSAQRVAMPAPPLGLIVFQTDDLIGYWYYDGVTWQYVSKGQNQWALQGNAGMVPATNFVGSSNNMPLSIRTAANEHMHLTTTGRVGVGTATPNEILEVDGAIKVTNTSATDDAGAIRWNATLNAHEGNIDGTPTGWYELENVFQEELNEDYEVINASCNPLPSTIGQGLTIGNGATATVGTIEPPYATFWEDHRVQYLWRASELAAAGMCPNFDITALSFSPTSSATSQTMNNAEIKMKNTTALDLPDFELTGLTTVWSNAAFSPVSTAAGGFNWIQHAFSTNYQWVGGTSLIVEFCFDNSTWTNNRQVRADNTSFAALYGLFCDACGGTGTVPCGVPPAIGQGAKGGCQLETGDDLETCDGTFQFQGGIGARNKRPVVQFHCYTGTVTTTLMQDDYIHASLPLVIGDAAWAPQTAPYYAFKGPGTISAENQVWGPNLLNDHVFDMYFDGVPHPHDQEKVQGYRFYTIDEMVNYVEKERHLPTMQGREEWNKQGVFSLSDLGSQLWVTVEQQALYIKELNERMKLLEKHLVKQQLGKE